VRVRLRDFPDADELARMYAVPHDAGMYGSGHDLRVRATIDLGITHCGRIGAVSSVADLSCGNGRIGYGIQQAHTLDPRNYGGKLPEGTTWGCDLILGDFAAPEPGRKTWPTEFDYVGPIEDTVAQLYRARRGNPVDVFVLSETIEHLEVPDLVLAQVRNVARQLLLSTPIGEVKPPPGAGNPEHIWGWNQEDVRVMLDAAGWMAEERVDLLLPGTYSYQIWRAT
jgi:hypothetical protein